MYALFTAIPLVGHINPLLRQAEALHRRGHRVAFAGAAEVRAHVASEAPAVRFIDLGPLGPIAGELRQAQELASMDPSFVRGAARIVDSLWRVWPGMYDGLRAAMAAELPDVVVADLFSSAGLSAAEAAGVPCVVNNPDLLGAISPKILPAADHLPMLFSGLSPRQLSLWSRLAAPLLRRAAVAYASATVGRRLNALRASRGLLPVDVNELLRDRQVLVDGAFGIEYQRSLPPNVAMVGAMLPERTPPLPQDLDEWLAHGLPVVYVNLGTLVVAPDAQLVKMAEAFAAGRTFRTLWILRPGQASCLPSPRPAGVRVLDWGPAPASVLSHPSVKVFVSHCGINSAHESIAAGTPIVGIPMFADQRDMAVRVADAGIGVWLDKRRFTAAALHAAILRVLDDPSFARAIPAAQLALASAGGAGRAADLIERAARTSVAA